MRAHRRTIVPMGGGGFSMEPDPRLDDWILGLATRRRPRVAFVGTASGDADGYAARFLAAFPSRRATASVLPLFRRTADDLRATVLAQDVVYVGGGNTANLLAVWRVHGLDRVLREAWRRGVVLCGVSAGALCWHEGGTTDSFGPVLAPLKDGLGLLRGSFSPHYDGEPTRRPVYHALVARGALPDGYAADDGVALRYEGRRLAEVVTSREGTSAYRVVRRGRRAVETPVPTRWLPASRRTR